MDSRRHSSAYPPCRSGVGAATAMQERKHSIAAAAALAYPIQNWTWDDVVVVVTMSTTNLTHKQKKGGPIRTDNATCLQGFRLNGEVEMRSVEQGGSACKIPDLAKVRT